MELKENERIDDLQLNDLKIIQNEKYFCFDLDSVILSDYVKEIHKGSNILDLGAGNGILELLLSAKIENSKITGVEVQEELYEIAKRNIKLNKLENRIQMKKMNVKEIDGKEKYDVVITNPPYKKQGTGLLNNEDSKAISRHEILGNLEDFIKAGSISLNDKGTIYMVHRPERIVEIFECLTKYNLEPKELTLVCSRVGSSPFSVLIKAVKNGNSYLSIRAPIYIYGENGQYTGEVEEIFIKK